MSAGHYNILTPEGTLNRNTEGRLDNSIAAGNFTLAKMSSKYQTAIPKQPVQAFPKITPPPPQRDYFLSSRHKFLPIFNAPDHKFYEQSLT
jgi:hypothetical protein